MFDLVCGLKHINVEKRELLTKGSNGIAVSFTFGQDWANLSKIAIFKYGGNQKDIVLTAASTTIPWECLQTVGDEVIIGVYGADEYGKVVIPTLYAKLGEVVEGADPSGDESYEETADVVAQVIALADGAKQLAQEAKTKVDTIDGAVAESAENARTAAENARTAADDANGAKTVADEAKRLAQHANAAASNAETTANAANAVATAANDKVNVLDKRVGSIAAQASTANHNAADAKTIAAGANDFSRQAKVNADKALANATAVWQAYVDGELKGEKGDKGDDGKTPVKGVDYFTDADLAEIASKVHYDDTEIKSDIAELNEDLTALDTRLVRIEDGADTVNIFSLENATEGYYVSSSGQLVVNPNVGVTDYIDLNGFNGAITYYFATALTHQGAFYNADKVFISGFYLQGIGEHSIDIPANARYVRLDYVLAAKDKYYCLATNAFLQKIDTVKINGTALDKVDGAVDIPLAKTGGDAGVVKVAYGQGFHIDSAGQLNAYTENSYIDSRLTGRPLSMEHLDYAVKAAMTDGKGADYTDAEKQSARERFGLGLEDLSRYIAFGSRWQNYFQVLSGNTNTFVRLGNLIFFSVACRAIQNTSTNVIDYMYQIPTQYAPKGNSVGLAYNSSKRSSGFCYVRSYSGQLVVKTTDQVDVDNEIDITMFWTI